MLGSPTHETSYVTVLGLSIAIWDGKDPTVACSALSTCMYAQHGTADALRPGPPSDLTERGARTHQAEDRPARDTHGRGA